MHNFAIRPLLHNKFNIMRKEFKKLYVIPVALAFASAAAQGPSKATAGIDPVHMDLNTKPSHDFFRFVNGAWYDKTEIPSDKTRWGSFDELRESTNRDVFDIINKAASNPAYKSNTDQGKAVNLYKSIMDTVSRNKHGVKPLKPYLDKIDAIKNIGDLQRLMVEMEPYGGIGFVGIGIGRDAKNSNRYVVSVRPGTLGLPDQDYYLSDDADSKEKREKYVAHVAKMLQFIGYKPAEANTDAAKILALEIAMSKPRFNRVERRDSRKSYNPMTIAELQKITPALNWNSYLQTAGFPKVDTLIVSQPKYMEALQGILTENNISSWKAYMKWTLLNRAASQLSTTIDDANFEFYEKTLKGAITQRPLEQRAVNTVNSILGEAVGRLYVDEKFPPEAKAKAEHMIKNIFTAFENRINNLTWMSAETKKSAIEKLMKSRVKVGYPDAEHWKDYSKLEIAGPEENGTYFENMRNYAKWDFEKDIADFDKPVNKNEWFTSPQTVNAYYSSSSNEIVFPAGILQPPFYNYQADEAVNYGGIGAVIGHEISHGFDDSGSRYNADGNLVNWWSESDLTQFTALGSALADQYSKLEPVPGVFVDGKFTLGENIGDLGGVNAAYDGLQLHLKENGRPGLIDGFTPEQRFFISWATIWRTKSREEALKNQVKTDSHTPGMFRAYVPLQNVDAFYEAFGIEPGDGMYLAPENRVKIW